MKIFHTSIDIKVLLLLLFILTLLTNNYFSFGNTIYHKTKPDQGIDAKIKEFERQNNIKLPDMFVVSRHQYAKKARLYESEYYYNPEVDGKTHKEFLKNWIGHKKFYIPK